MGGRDLWALFLEKHCPLVGRPPPLVNLTAMDCAKIAYEYAHTIHEGCRLAEIDLAAAPKWSEAHRKEVDLAIGDIIDAADLQPISRLSFGGLVELLTRLKWIASALVLQDAANEPWSLPVPQSLGQDLKEVLVLITLLGGEGREYPPRFREGQLP